MCLELTADQLPAGRSVGLVINKIDRVPAERLLALAAKMNSLREFDATFMISAERGHGVEDLKQWLGRMVPAGPWLYPDDQIADVTERLIAYLQAKTK